MVVKSLSERKEKSKLHAIHTVQVTFESMFVKLLVVLVIFQKLWNGQPRNTLINNILLRRYFFPPLPNLMDCQIHRPYKALEWAGTFGKNTTFVLESREDVRSEYGERYHCRKVLNKRAAGLRREFLNVHAEEILGRRES